MRSNGTQHTQQQNKKEPFGLKRGREERSSSHTKLWSGLRYCISITSVWIIWAMSVYWFYRITLGMMKVLRQTAQPQAEGDTPAAVRKAN